MGFWWLETQMTSWHFVTSLLMDTDRSWTLDFLFSLMLFPSNINCFCVWREHLEILIICNFLDITAFFLWFITWVINCHDTEVNRPWDLTKLKACGDIDSRAILNPYWKKGSSACFTSYLYISLYLDSISDSIFG